MLLKTFELSFEDCRSDQFDIRRIDQYMLVILMQ